MLDEIDYDSGRVDPMLNIPMLHGEEVTLRPLLATDDEALASAAAEDRSSYGFSQVPNGIDATRAYVSKALVAQAAGNRMPFTILWRDRIVGTTSYAELSPWAWPEGSSLQRIGQPDTVEIGYTWLAASAQRTRVNIEAKSLLLAHAFDVWQVHGVFLQTDERNQRSRSAIEGLGARFEGIRRAHKPGVDGTVRNSAYFSILRGEWPDIKRSLAARLER